MSKDAIDVAVKMRKDRVIRRGRCREATTHIGVGRSMWRVQRSANPLETLRIEAAQMRTGYAANRDLRGSPCELVLLDWFTW